MIDMKKNATVEAVQPDLLECPFCGPVEIVHRWAGNVEIKHKPACFLHAITTLHGAAHIAAWNRRYSNARLDRQEEVR
jgi:hypothetical protein